MERKINGKVLWKQSLIFGGVSFLIACLLSGAAAFLVVREIAGQDLIEILSPAISALSVFLGCFFAAKRTKSKNLLMALSAAVIYLVITILAKLAFFPGAATLLPRNCFICFASAFLGFLTTKVQKKRTRYHIRARGR